MGQERRTTGHRRTYPTRGIFPKYDEANNLDYHGRNELEDAGSQISHGDILNYTFVLDNLEDAKIELDRYRSEGFMVDVDKDTVAKEMSHGTISRLGLIVKEKPEKNHIGREAVRGNKKAVLPEKLLLRRLRDAIAMITEKLQQRCRRRLLPRAGRRGQLGCFHEQQ